MLSLLFPTMVEVNGLFGDVPHEGHLLGVEASFSDQATMSRIGGPKAAAAAKAFIGRERAHWREHSFGMWFFRDLESGSFAGWGGIRRIDGDAGSRTELCCVLRPEYQGRGSATEIGKLAVQLGFENLGLTEVVSIVHRDHVRGEAVLVRCGFTSGETTERFGEPHILFRIGSDVRRA